MNGLPIDYGAQMHLDYFQLQPSWVKGRYNTATEMHRRYLYNLLFSVYRFTLPDAWPLNFFRYFVFYFGSLAAIYTKEFGWMVQPYGITRITPYYQPAAINVFNRFLKTEKIGVIGVNAEIIKIMDDYGGLDDLVVSYAEKLAAADKSINVNFMNSNVALLAQAENQKDAQDIQTAYAKATEGNPMVLVNKKLLQDGPLRTLIDAPKSNFIALEMLQARREIENEFLTRIGIRTANYDKRAQMSDDEVRQKDGESKALCSVILENLKECFVKVNRISGLGLRVDYNEEVTGNGKTDALGDAGVLSKPAAGDNAS